MTIIAQPIRTTMDGNGNSRRGWLVYQTQGDGAYLALLGFVIRELHMSDGSLRDALPGVVFLGELKLAPAEYRTAKQSEETVLRVRAISDAMEGN